MFEVLQSCVWIYEYICQKIYTSIKIEDFWINNLALQGELQKSWQQQLAWVYMIPFNLIWECQLVSRVHLHISWALARGIYKRRVKRVFTAALSLCICHKFIITSPFCVICSSLQILFKERSGNYRAKLNTAFEIYHKVLHTRIQHVLWSFALIQTEMTTLTTDSN